MRKLFSVYVANEMSSDGRSATLQLPATDCELLDLLDKIQLRECDLMYWEVEDYNGFEYIAPFLNDETNLYDFNALAKRLALMGAHDSIAFEGLVKIDEADSAVSMNIGRLIDLAYSAEDCHVVDVINDEQLGRFYADNDFVPELEDVPSGLYEKLDFAKIGREMRVREYGSFTNRGYVLHTQGVRNVYERLDTRPKKPDYVFRLELISSLTGELAILTLPATAEQIHAALRDMSLDSWEGAELYDFDGVIRGMDIDLYHLGGVNILNELAKKVRDIDAAGDLQKYKALLHAADCHDIETACILSETLDDYVYSPDICSYRELGLDQLRFSLSGEAVSLLEKHVNLDGYGRDVAESEHAILTSYGLIQREGGTPIMGVQNEQLQADMQMF